MARDGEKQVGVLDESSCGLVPVSLRRRDGKDRSEKDVRLKQTRDV